MEWQGLAPTHRDVFGGNHQIHCNRWGQGPPTTGSGGGGGGRGAWGGDAWGGIVGGGSRCAGGGGRGEQVGVVLGRSGGVARRGTASGPTS